MLAERGESTVRHRWNRPGPGPAGKRQHRSGLLFSHEVALADVALAVLEAALHHEHPTIDDPHERDPPTLRAARGLRRRIRALRDELHGYRRAVLDHDELIEELPF